MRQAVAKGVRYRGEDIGEHEDARREEAGAEGFAKCENEYIAQAMVKLELPRIVISIVIINWPSNG